MRTGGKGRNGFLGKKSSAKAEGGVTILFPGPEGWELWSGPAHQPVCTGPAEQPRKLRPVAGCVMGLPTRSFFSLPLWVPVVEDSPAREQTQIKLEMKGMLGANPEAAIWNYDAIRKEVLPPSPEGETMTRQLEATAVLTVPFQEDWLVEEASRHEPAARMLVPPAGGSCGVLRRELGRWVADFYVEGKWLHSQTLLSAELDASAAVELAATQAQLQGEGVLSRLDGWWVREAGARVGADFRQGLELPVHLEDRTPPQPSSEAWNLPPPALTELRTERAQGAKRKRLIRTGLLAYAAVGLFFVAWLIWPLIRLKTARNELARIGDEAGQIRQTALLWREGGACFDPRRNVLELLWQVSRPLIEADPPQIEGVRLTLFDANNRRVSLQGEGKDLEVVEKYFNWLKAEPSLAFLQWKHPQPRLLPTGNAQFQVEGSFPGMEEAESEGGDNAETNAP